MKVLFVYRGFGNKLTNSVVDAQAKSLINNGVDLSFFPINGGGLKGYINTYYQLKEFLDENKFDIVHGHYSYSAIIAALAFKGKTICSLMGSDVFQENICIRLLTQYFVKFIWRRTIVKSQIMKKKVKHALIIPNGVDFNKFKPIDMETACSATNFDKNKFNIIFVAEDINSKEKNYKLAKQAVDMLNDPHIELHLVSGVKQNDLIYYYNAADLYLMTSISEGSPNVIKEAMACNCPVVSTDVGDVRDILKNTQGCYITSFDPRDVAQKIKLVMEFGSRTDGRDAISHLDSNSIAKKIIKEYEEIL